MKICNLKIYDPQSKLIRDIDFQLNGISFVLGDIEAPKDKSKTSNSIGKTLLLKLIDYIFGANEDKKIIKSELENYYLVATVLYNDVEYQIKRTLGKSSSILIDDKPISLDEYKKFFDIDRSLLARQVILENKQSLISYFPKPTIDDYKAVLTLLQLNDICDTISKIYELQDKQKKVKDNISQILKLLNILDAKVSDEIFLLEKEIDELSKKILSVKSQVNKLELNEENTSYQKEYSELNSKVKSIRSLVFELISERDSLEKYINDRNTSNLDANTIKAIYERAKIELPSIIVKSLDEVDGFYKAIYEDRILQAKTRLEQINQSIIIRDAEIASIEQRLDELSQVLSMNDAYKNALAILYAHNNQLQQLKFRQGQLSQVELYIKEENSIQNELLSEYSNLGLIKEVFEETHKKYKNFIYNIVNKIYDKTTRAVFDIAFYGYEKKRRPISVDMAITGDAGEGVKEVKKIIMDYLLFYFNHMIDTFIHDSSCYNGVDPRQVSGLIKELGQMTKENGKQVIVSINKYQLTDDNFINEVREKSCVILSENKKLLLFDF